MNVIKGVNRRIIEIQETDSSCFEKAVLYVRPDCDVPPSRLEAEARLYARRIMNSGELHEHKKQDRFIRVLTITVTVLVIAAVLISAALLIVGI